MYKKWQTAPCGADAPKPQFGLLALVSVVPGCPWPYYLCLIKISRNAYRGHMLNSHSPSLLCLVVLHDTYAPSETICFTYLFCLLSTSLQ